MAKEAICGVYMITNIVNGKIYIGSSNDIKKRWAQHKRELKNGTHDNPHLQNAWNLYGESNFKFEILEECSLKEQFQKEQVYLDTFQPFGNTGYNIVHKISNDLVGGTTISNTCERCHKNYNTFSHLSKYCPSCKDEILIENWESYQGSNSRCDHKSGFDLATKRLILQTYGSMEYFWECNC